MRRRSLLTTAALTAIAGCTANNGGDDTSPVEDPDTDPSEFLPDDGDEFTLETESSWEIDELGSTVADAVKAEYTDDDGGEYNVGIARFEDEVEAEDIDHDAADDDLDGELEFGTTTGIFTGIITVADGDRVEDLTDRSDLWR